MNIIPLSPHSRHGLPFAKNADPLGAILKKFVKLGIGFFWGSYEVCVGINLWFTLWLRQDPAEDTGPAPQPDVLDALDLSRKDSSSEQEAKRALLQRVRLRRVSG